MLMHHEPAVIASIQHGSVIKVLSFVVNLLCNVTQDILFIVIIVSFFFF